MVFPEIKRVKKVTWYMNDKDKGTYPDWVVLYSYRDILKERKSRAKWAKALVEKIKDLEQRDKTMYTEMEYIKINKELLKQAGEDEKWTRMKKSN